MVIIKTSICVCLLALITACSNYGNNDSREHINKKIQTKEQTTKELETISLFYDGSGDTSIVSLMSNGLIYMVEKGSDDIDTLEFTDKNDKLFIDLQRVLDTAKIDMTLRVGEIKIDSVYKFFLVRNDTKGYIINHGIYTHTIPITDPKHEEYKNGIFKDIALNDTATKRMLLLLPWENDIQADYMLLYHYNDKTIPNDTLCFGSSDRNVRINSYIAEVDSVLFENVSGQLRELTFEQRPNYTTGRYRAQQSARKNRLPVSVIDLQYP